MKLEHGQPVTFIDSQRRRIPALVTNIFGDGETNPQACNLVFVSPDENRTDGSGRQIERASSVVHVSQNSARQTSRRL